MRKLLLPIDIKLDYSLLPSVKQKKISLKKTKHYHKHRRTIPNIIRSRIDEHEIVYGARALNKRFPPYLDKYTEDYDIYTPHPKRDAHETEQALDKRFGGDFFYVEPARHPNTFRVKSHTDGSVAADYTKPEQKIPYDMIGDVKYVKLGFVKKHIHKTLRDPEASYRHQKDLDVLNRIKLYERMKK